MPAAAEMAVRAFREDDRPFFQSVASRLVPNGTASPRDPEVMADFMSQLAAGTRDLPQGTEILVAVDEHDRPLGLTAVHLDTDHFTAHRRAYVEVLVVASAAEGKGVGRALMQAIERWGRAHDCREVVLDVFANNEAAIAFYQHVGYRPDHIRMAKPLDAEPT